MLPRTLVLVALAAAGCATPDLSGDYVVEVTTGPRGCPTPDLWEEGTAAGIDLTVTHDVDDPGGGVTLVVGGTTGFFYGRSVGEFTLTGEATGGEIEASVLGDLTYRAGMCTWDWRLELDATVTGDDIGGTITWVPVTNEHPDCGEYATCRNTQTFAGARPSP